MKFYIIIPAHNEALFINKTLKSLAQQTLLPKKVVVVNDNSTDATPKLIQRLSNKYDWINTLDTVSLNKHSPGSKVINAFYKGFGILDEKFDIICKFDADIILPKNYLEKLAVHFRKNPRLGMASGHCYIEKNNTWQYENIANKTHIRGPIKAYRKACFEAIGGLKASIGWDTVDELLAQYHNWETLTDSSLKVKHLKPTGHSYNKLSKTLQGKALYKMRYGFWLMSISALKMAYNTSSFIVLKNYIAGYVNAKRHKATFIVSIEEGRFIRKYRWKAIMDRLF